MYYHHGYLLTGDTEAALDAAFSMSREILGSQDIKTHSDLSFFDDRLFSIDDARKVREDSTQRSFSGKGRIFLIRCVIMSREAANALLKTFEEPHAECYFFLVIGSPDHLPDTLRSRLVHLPYRIKEPSDDKIKFVKDFLESNVPGRMEMIEKIAAEREKAENFLDIMEIVVRGKILKDISREPVARAEEIYEARRLLLLGSSSPKLVLEHLVLTLPKM